MPGGWQGLFDGYKTAVAGVCGVPTPGTPSRRQLGAFPGGLPTPQTWVLSPQGWDPGLFLVLSDLSSLPPETSPFIPTYQALAMAFSLHWPLGSCPWPCLVPALSRALFLHALLPRAHKSVHAEPSPLRCTETPAHPSTPFSSASGHAAGLDAEEEAEAGMETDSRA